MLIVKNTFFKKKPVEKKYHFVSAFVLDIFSLMVQDFGMRSRKFLLKISLKNVLAFAQKAELHQLLKAGFQNKCRL